MTTVKVGISTRSLRQPLRKALATAARLGADGVQIDLRNELPLADLSQTAIRQLRKMVEDHRLRVAAVSFPTRRGYEEPADLDRRVQATRQAMQAAAALGARVVVNRAYGRLPAPDTPQRDALMTSLEALASEGNRVGARLAALTTSAPAEELAGVLADLPDGTVGVTLHPANLLSGGQSPLEALAHLGRNVLHVQAVDAVRDFGSNRTVEVELGRGTADLPALAAALDGWNYTGWFIAERTDSDDPVTELENAVAYLQNLTA